MFYFIPNFVFVVQNSAQSHFWNDDQCSIFTVVVYYNEEMREMQAMFASIGDRGHYTLILF